MGREVEFLPAALEIEETPPSPIGRGIVLTIILAFLAALAWALVGRVDIVAVAAGRVIPSGHSKVIQPPETGVVRRINVVEGQQVRVGDPLIELDADVARAELTRLQQQVDASERDMWRLETLARWLRDGVDDPIRVKEVRLPPAQRQQLLAQWRAHQAHLGSLRNARRKHRLQRNAARHELEKLQALLPIVSQRAEKLAQLSSQKYLAEEQYLEVEQRRLEILHGLAAQKDRAEQLQAAGEETAARLDHAHRDFQGKVLGDLVAAQRRQAELAQQMVKARKQLQRLTLRAPLSGVVQQLAVHTIGGVVTAAQQLMVVVPDDAELEVEARVENKDIGFVHAGQPAEIKFDAFPFTRYGVIEARVTGLAKDAVADQKLGLVYRARVLLARSSIAVDGKRVGFSPGMKVAVEIKTGKRRLIEYFLSPLLRYRQESIRER